MAVRALSHCGMLQVYHCTSTVPWYTHAMEIRKPGFIAYVTAYGHLVPYGAPPDRVAYRAYLQLCADAIAQACNETHASERCLIFLCGGVRDAQGETEGESAVKHFRSLLSVRGVQGDVTVAALSQAPLPARTGEGPQPIVCSEQTAWHVLMTQSLFPDARVCYFVDEVRATYARQAVQGFVTAFREADRDRVAFCAQHVEVVGIPREDSHPNSTPEAQERALAQLESHGAKAVMFSKIAAATGLS